MATIPGESEITGANKFAGFAHSGILPCTTDISDDYNAEVSVNIPKVIITRPPILRIVTRRPGEVAIHSRTVPAIKPHDPSEKKANTENVAPMRTS